MLAPVDLFDKLIRRCKFTALQQLQEFSPSRATIYRYRPALMHRCSVVRFRVVKITGGFAADHQAANRPAQGIKSFIYYIGA